MTVRGLTPEQQKADAELEAAIISSMRAYGLDVDRMLTDWVVLCASQGVSDEEEGTTSYQYLTPGRYVTWHRLLGLIESVRLIIKGHFINNRGNTDD